MAYIKGNVMVFDIVCWNAVVTVIIDVLKRISSEKVSDKTEKSGKVYRET